MNRAILPAAGVAALALAVLAGSALPVAQPSVPAGLEDDRARSAVVCPAVPGSGPATAVAAGSPQAGLTTATLAAPDAHQAVPGPLAVVSPATGPVVVSAPRLDVFSATTRSAAETGSDRGLAMMSCVRPAASAWFAGVLSSEAGNAEVVLLNADTSDAVVDLAVYGTEGRVNAPGSRGIVVAARSRRVVPLGPLFSSEQPVSVHVSTSAGRVAAAVRQRRSSGAATGTEWLPPTADPATAVLIPGLPSGRGVRDLVVVNPGERTASVVLQVLGAAGPTAVPGFETLDLPAGTSRIVPLAGALAEAPVGLRLSSQQRITAAVLSGNGAGPDAADVSSQVATPALTGSAALASGPGSRTLHLAAATAEPAGVRVLMTDGGRTLLDSTVAVPGLANVTVRLPAAGRAALISLEPTAPGAVHASVAVRARLGEVIGVSSLAVFAGAAAATLPPVRPDPRVGA